MAMDNEHREWWDHIAERAEQARIAANRDAYNNGEELPYPAAGLEYAAD